MSARLSLSRVPTDAEIGAAFDRGLELLRSRGVDIDKLRADAARNVDLARLDDDGVVWSEEPADEM